MFDNKSPMKNIEEKGVGVDKNTDHSRMQQLEQALIDIQADKCRIQRMQEDLVLKVDHHRFENDQLNQKLALNASELEASKLKIQTLEKELSEKEDENIVVHICVQKLQEELDETTKELSEKEALIEQKDIYIASIKKLIEAKKQSSFPRCRGDLIKSLAFENPSSV